VALRSLLDTDTDDTDDDADDRWPKRKEEQESRTHRIGIGIWPQPYSCRKDNEQEWTAAHEQQPETEFNPPGPKICAHPDRGEFPLAAHSVPYSLPSRGSFATACRRLSILVE
jgi:hypothetical protein